MFDKIFVTNLLLGLLFGSLWAQFVLKRLHHRRTEQHRKDEKRKTRAAQIIGRLVKPLSLIAGTGGKQLTIARAPENGRLTLADLSETGIVQDELIKVRINLLGAGNKAIVVEMKRVELPEFNFDYDVREGDDGAYHFFADDSGIERAVQLFSKIAQKSELLRLKKV